MEGDDDAGGISTAAIDRLMRAGMKGVTYFDTSMHNNPAGNPEQLWAWFYASTVQRSACRDKKAQSSPIAAVVPAAPAGVDLTVAKAQPRWQPNLEIPISCHVRPGEPS